MAKHFGSCRPKSRTRTRLNADQSASAYPSLRSTSIIFASPPNDRSFLIQKLRRKRALLHIWQRSRQTDKFGRQVLRPVSKAGKVSRVLFLFPRTADPVDIVLAWPWISPERDGHLSAIKDGGKIATPRPCPWILLSRIARSWFVGFPAV